MPVEFEDKDNRFSKTEFNSPRAKRPYFTRLLVERGIAKDDASADRILLITSILLILFSIAIFVWVYLSNNTNEVPYSFPESLLVKLPMEIQTKIRDILYGFKN